MAGPGRIGSIGRWAALVAVAVATRGLALAQDVIALRASAELPAAGPVALAQIADLSGPQAERLGATIVPMDTRSPGGDGWVAIDVAAVREALCSAPGVNWGRLVVRGSACAVRRAGADTPANPVRSDAARAPAPEGPTVRALVDQRVRDALGGGSDVRITFDEADRAVLDTAMPGRSADVQLLGSSERQAVSVKVYEGLHQVLSATVRVGVSVKRTVAVCTAGLRRGDAMSSDTVSVEERWVSPTLRPHDPSKVVGRLARGRIEAGDVIEEKDAESPVVVKKGDLVDVYCLSGSINLKSVARALEAGREGDAIRFQTPDAKRTFQARVDGPGRAVTAVGALAGASDDAGAVRGEKRPAPGASSPGPGTRESAARKLRYMDLGDRPMERAGAPGKDGTR